MFGDSKLTPGGLYVEMDINNQYLTINRLAK